MTAKKPAAKKPAPKQEPCKKEAELKDQIAGLEDRLADAQSLANMRANTIARIEEMLVVQQRVIGRLRNASK